MNRREILKLLAVNTGLLIVGPRIASSETIVKEKKGKILFPSGSGKKGLSGSRYPNYFHVFDLDTLAYKTFEVPQALTHDCVPLAHDKDHVLVLEKDGPNACVLNIVTGEIAGKFQASKGCVLSGHGLVDPEKSHFITSEFGYHQDVNKLVIRDLKNPNKIVGEIADMGVRPHEMVFFGGPRNIAVGHYGYISYDKKANIEGEIRLVNLDSGKTIKNYTSGNWYSPCHIKKIDEKSFLAASHSMVLKNIEQRGIAGKEMYDYESRKVSLSPLRFFNVIESPMVYFHEDRGVQEVYPETAKTKWTVGMALDIERKQMVSTSTFSQHLSLWNTSTGQSEGLIDLPGKPSGVYQTLDKSEWIVIDHKSKLYGVDVETFKIKWKRSLENPKIGVTPHIHIV